MGTLNIVSSLFPKVQQGVLGMLYSHPDTDFHTNEIIRHLNAGRGAVQRELARLASAGILAVTKLGNQKRYTANQKNLLYHELRSIVLKTFGLADVISEALTPLKDSIKVAFIYGSIAKQQDTAESDIDLMIISEDLTYSDLFSLLMPAEEELLRKINPTFYTPFRWRKKINEHNNFVQKTIADPKIFLVGSENDLSSLG